MGAKSQAKYHGQTPEFEGQCEGARSSDGLRCRRQAMTGMNVCRRHGGGAPQAQRAARERLAMLVSPAIAKLKSALDAKKNDKHFTPQLQIAAARDVLDRNGLKSKDELVVRAEFDATRFAEWPDADIEQFIALARRATKTREATDAPVEEGD